MRDWAEAMEEKYWEREVRGVRREAGRAEGEKDEEGEGGAAERSEVAAARKADQSEEETPRWSTRKAAEDADEGEEVDDSRRTSPLALHRFDECE
jgi:hypothetical protein